MRVRTMVKNLTEPEKEQFDDYLEKKIDGLRPILEAHYPDEDTVVLIANMQRHEKHTAFEFEYVLEMPHARLVASETKHSVTESLDFATQKLERQIVDHFNRLARK